MVKLLVKQSIEIKCKLKESKLLGNYEFYYALGYLARLTGVNIQEEEVKENNPLELKKVLMEKFKTVDVLEEEGVVLKKLIEEYIPGEEYDDDMCDLLFMGLKET